MSAIARSLHISKSAIYYHFTSREDIFRALSEKDGKRLRQNLEESAMDSNDPRTRIRAFMISHFKNVRAMTSTYTTLRDDYLKYFAVFLEHRKEIDRFETCLLRDILADGVKRGAFSIPEENIECVAQSMMLGMHSLEYEWFIKLDASPNFIMKIDIMMGILDFGISTSRITT